MPFLLEPAFGLLVRYRDPWPIQDQSPTALPMTIPTTSEISDTTYHSLRTLTDPREPQHYICKVVTLLSRFSLITIELEPDILYIKGVLNDNCDGL